MTPPTRGHLTMKIFTTPYLRLPFNLGIATALAGLLSMACDLPDKDLGADPTGTSGGTATAGDSGPCVDGETRMEDCNTCICEGGGWSCTEIGCSDGSGTAGGTAGACDSATLPDCGDCVCEDGGWSCNDIGCDPTGGETGSTGGDECDPETEPNDGCNECICLEGEWACTDLACPGGDPVAVCSGGEVIDPFTIQTAAVVGDQLLLTVEYSGGCMVHDFGSCWDESFAESEPVQVSLTISHEDNDDPCDSLPVEMLAYDLTPVRNAWIDAYQQLSGTITLNVSGWGAIDYSF